MNSNNFSLIIPTTCRAKGLKNKNFRKIKNLSLVETLIKNPLNWKYLEAYDIYISSDSNRFLNISKKYKINIIKRPCKMILTQ